MRRIFVGTSDDSEEQVAQDLLAAADQAGVDQRQVVYVAGERAFDVPDPVADAFFAARGGNGDLSVDDPADQGDNDGGKDPPAAPAKATKKATKAAAPAPPVEPNAAPPADPPVVM